jgi:hypothetical protein
MSVKNPHSRRLGSLQPAMNDRLTDSRRLGSLQPALNDRSSSLYPYEAVTRIKASVFPPCQKQHHF